MRTLGVRRSSHVSSPVSWRSLQRSKLQGLSAGGPCRLVSLGSMGLEHSVSLLYDVSWSVGAGAPNRRSTSGQRSSSNHFPHPQSRHDLNWRRRRRGHGKPRIRTEKSDDRREIDEWFTRHHTEHRRGSDTTEGLSSFLIFHIDPIGYPEATPRPPQNVAVFSGSSLQETEELAAEIRGSSR